MTLARTPKVRVMSPRKYLLIGMLVTGCGSTANHDPGTGVDGGVGGDGGRPSGDGGIDGGGTPVGTPMSCPGPGIPKPDNGSCGSERWDIKTGIDSHAATVSLVPQPNTIAALIALPAAGAGTNREVPTESTVWELKNVTLTELKLETDNDYHMVLSDGSKTLIAEIPSVKCATTSVWKCFMSRARSEVDARYTVSTSPTYPATTITVRGVGFFDLIHGQNGVAANGIELHPVLELCFGKDCVPD
jgi:hypothetical protein